MQTNILRSIFCAGLLFLAALGTASGQTRIKARTIPANTLVVILRAEDERRWDDDLKRLLSAGEPTVRAAAALAAGRIGDDHAVDSLVKLLNEDRNRDVRQMSVFAIGEIESAAGADALLNILNDADRTNDEVRARAVEALGKIAAALPDAEKDRKRLLGEAIVKTLRFESTRQPRPDRLTTLLGLTAALRTRPDGAGEVAIQLLAAADPRIVADALNMMARLRLKDGTERVRGLLNHIDPIVRANAARVLGAIEDKQPFENLLARALIDSDSRVRVSAIRALGNLKDSRAIQPLLTRAAQLLKDFKVGRAREIVANSAPKNELLEVVTTLARVIVPLQEAAAQPNEKLAVELFKETRKTVYGSAPEIEIAYARVAPFDYVEEFRKYQFSYIAGSPPMIFPGYAQGLGEIASVKSDQDPKAVDEVKQTAKRVLAGWMALPENLDRNGKPSVMAKPEVMQAWAKFKPTDLAEVMRQHLRASDVVVRGTAAELLADLPPDAANASSLIEALHAELPRTEKGGLNDALLAILGALAKQKNPEANQAIKTAFDSSDYLIRRRAVTLLKTNGVGDFSDRIGTVKTRNTEIDYRRAIARIGRQVTAILDTTKGPFTIEFFPEAAPLTVDNFVQLARKGYFNRISFHRVVPNFVIQGGDPRGDGNGGPGYSIRCEINEHLFERAVLGMALSGKDTGGSQWFVTHSPQPHLDGGYTIFGRVVSGMSVVDNIARGDVIRRVIVNEK